MGILTRVAISWALLFTAAATATAGTGPANLCAQNAPQVPGAIGFLVLSDSAELIPASEAAFPLDKDTKVLGFIVCVPIDLTRVQRMGAINLKMQIYSAKAKIG